MDLVTVLQMGYGVVSLGVLLSLYAMAEGLLFSAEGDAVTGNLLGVVGASSLLGVLMMGWWMMNALLD